jgi:hypothetical protein
LTPVKSFGTCLLRRVRNEEGTGQGRAGLAPLVGIDEDQERGVDAADVLVVDRSQSDDGHEAVEDVFLLLLKVGGEVSDGRGEGPLKDASLISRVCLVKRVAETPRHFTDREDGGRIVSTHCRYLHRSFKMSLRSLCLERKRLVQDRGHVFTLSQGRRGTEDAPESGGDGISERERCEGRAVGRGGSISQWPRRQGLLLLAALAAGAVAADLPRVELSSLRVS